MNWISVKDKLPHVPDGCMGVEVLVFTAQENWLVGLYGSDGTWTLYNSRQVCHPGEVTHWCEIVPPKKSQPI